MPILALIVMGVWWFVIKPITQEQGHVRVETGFALCGEGARQKACVVDGDTVHIGFGSDRRRIRLTGFDAPEIDGAVYLRNVAATLAAGDIVKVTVEEADEHDLFGVIA